MRRVESRVWAAMNISDDEKFIRHQQRMQFGVYAHIRRSIDSTTKAQRMGRDSSTNQLLA